MELNDTKCELITLIHTKEEDNQTHSIFRALVPRIKIVPAPEGELLGAPLSEHGLSSALCKKRDDLKRMVGRLEQIDNHQAFALLKNCLAIPRLQYIIRASPAYKQTDELKRSDEIVVQALSTVTNVHFEGPTLSQAVLPVSLGGLGVRLSGDIALPAFKSSLHSSSGLVEAILLNVQHLADVNELREAEEVWQERSRGFTLSEEAERDRQKTWDLPIAEATKTRLLESSDQLARARILASSCKESGVWLHAFPVLSLGTMLEPETFRIAIALRVGADVCEPHKCRCGRMMDSRGLHGLSCKYSAGRHPRHTALNDIIKRSLQSAGVPSVLEPVGVDRGDGRRPDGITVFPFASGRCLCWDATCVDTYAESNINNSAVEPGSAARGAEDAKRRKYEALTTRFRFEPIAVETSGVYGDTTASIIAEIGRRMTSVTGEPRETCWLKQRIGIAVQRGNAFSILSLGVEQCSRRGRNCTTAPNVISQLLASRL